MDIYKLGAPGAISPVEEKCAMDEFENSIRKIGIIAACEWFGYALDSEFTKDTVRVLIDRSSVRALAEGE